ncbi:MAG TPA: hypothetical protein VFV67_24380 [Actinophytocola sp.]|uniref:hypothetical protein n=1 Tax=Actinophytocola sp. TaxID=1872138 RepID=UPI002DB84485|nr:hypothetical protein [Actinophytocola sp.]HEU5473794.1 hypothetical protein [Actinophytocola sp.]
MTETPEPVRDAVLCWLDGLDRTVGHDDPSTLLPLARREINRMAEGWRLLLTVHQRDEDGRCGACPAGVRGRWPCQVWRMAHEQLIGEGVPRARRTGPLGRLARVLGGRGH